MIDRSGILTRRLQDMRDALSDSIAANGQENCQDCSAGFDAIVAGDQGNPTALCGELCRFSAHLRIVRMKKGCENCHPPVYKDL